MINNGRKINVKKGRQGFQETEKTAAAPVDLSAVASYAGARLTATPVGELSVGDKIGEDGEEIRTITSTDGDHRSISIEFDHDEENIETYFLGDTLDKVSSAPEKVPTILPAGSSFADAQSEEDVRDRYDALTSPENISWDGERPAGDAKKAADTYHREASQRLVELANWAKR